jgi:chaperonin cofactor prefoldin
MTTTIEWQDRVERLESKEDSLRTLFRETMGRMHDAMAADGARGTVLSAIRVTQLEHDEKLREHSVLLNEHSVLLKQHGEMLHEHGFLLKGLTEGQKRLDGRMDKLDGRVDKLDSRMGRIEGRMERLERLIRRGFGMNGVKVDGDED